MNKHVKNVILIAFSGLAVLAIIIFFINKNNKQEQLFQKMKAKTDLIDSTLLSATQAKEELLLINKDIWEKINKPIKTISSVKHSKLIIFINNDLGEGSALVSILDLYKVEPGMDLSEFYPQFKEHNPNKLKNVETFKINRESINALHKFLKRKAVLIYKAEILGNYTYIINMVE